MEVSHAPLVSAEAAHLPLALLVDRDVDTRKMYAEYLRLFAFDTEEAEDGREALAKALSRHPDIIVTETRLPGINGFDLCRLLREDDTTRAIPIVVVTGDAFDSDVSRATAVGADAVLVKPCLPEQLAVEVRRLLRHSHELHARARELSPTVASEAKRSEKLLERSRHSSRRRTMLSRAYHRCDTTEPPAAPPVLVCPKCDLALRYVRSHLGGVSEKHAEQWDYFECTAGCGTFQYRQRTRKLRHVI